ncbi:MAG TPA: hypothetical protein ENN06_12610 [Desulfobacteraceae bacterium]|nr:hypothetical protein [Desulfobacteraceae bacterium]
MRSEIMYKGSLVAGLFLAAFFVISSAMERSDEKITADAIPDDRQKRVHVVRVGVLLDDVAAGGKRGVYVITDRETGVEYIGISGIGIAETRK